MERAIDIELPTTSGGMLGRQCPHCQKRFRINHETYQNQHYLNLSCPYCRWIAEFEEFHTQEQIKHAESVGMDQVEDMVIDELEDIFGSGSVEGELGGITHESPIFSQDVSDIECPDCDFEYQSLTSEADSSCPVCRESN